MSVLSKGHRRTLSLLSSRADDLASEIEDLANVLQGEYDDSTEKSPKFPDTDTGEALLAAINDLEAIAGSIHDATHSLNEVHES